MEDAAAAPAVERPAPYALDEVADVEPLEEAAPVWPYPTKLLLGVLADG